MESSAKARAKETWGWIGDVVQSPRKETEPESVVTPETEADEAAETTEASARERVRRWTNVAMALVGLVLAAPLMLIIAALIRLTSKGPILYSQQRVGRDRRTSGSPGDEDVLEFPGPRGRAAKEDARARNIGGRLFTIYKFRTMYVDSCDSQVWCRPDDDRVTPVGRMLRKLHLDELPQLLNVLKGDMNVVGPRPEQPRIFQELAREVPRYRDRQRVRPGITGWAQVNHHYDRSLEDVKRKVELDLEYIQRRSALEDLKIAFRTVPAVLSEDSPARGW